MKHECVPKNYHLFKGCSLTKGKLLGHSHAWWGKELPDCILREVYSWKTDLWSSFPVFPSKQIYNFYFIFIKKSFWLIIIFSLSSLFVQLPVCADLIYYNSHYLNSAHIGKCTSEKSSLNASIIFIKIIKLSLSSFGSKKKPNRYFK